ncbi:MAG TPA: hypothetical protein DCZ94_09960 [Lentisphaeria bacterium]|nr:MAG: hypothetical protein A2X48_08375 [Lentisphaerae bacterium GWF2_49_21]HBC87268.1 hypothetical protein [Lentisphaeria bacterium]
MLDRIIKTLSACILLCVFGYMPNSPEPNQVQSLVSPSGKFVLTVPIEKRQENDTGRRWIVTIHDAKGVLMYRDSTSKFVPMLNVYWKWDSEDRVWLYNSDDSRIWFWVMDGAEWVKEEWGYRDTKVTKRDVLPPEDLKPPSPKSNK